MIFTKTSLKPRKKNSRPLCRARATLPRSCDSAAPVRLCRAGGAQGLSGQLEAPRASAGAAVPRGRENAESREQRGEMNSVRVSLGRGGGMNSVRVNLGRGGER